MAAVPQLIEGGTTLHVPAGGHVKGPKPRGGPFYNPAMRLARDVSVAAAAHEAATRTSGIRFLDGLAAAGARGLRIAHEVPACHVVLNDIDPKATARIEENRAALGLADAEVSTGPLEQVLAAERFDWVDVDPYGSPIRFLDAAVRGVRRGGIVSMAATDTATLNGLYPTTCRRRYDARSMRAPFGHELAVRLLTGAVVRAAARHDRAATPLLCHATDHYVRVYLRVEDGARRADEALGWMGYAWFDGRDRGVGPERPAEAAWAGPLWTGPLGDRSWVEGVHAEAGGRAFPRDTVGLLERLVEEAGAPALFTSMPELGRAVKGSLPRIDAFMGRLREAGHVAVRTHFDPQGVKTDADWAAMARLVTPP
jgi:tRNA (guanine26-N2/guanine27-N2)-dimethyltransferase